MEALAFYLSILAGWAAYHYAGKVSRVTMYRLAAALAAFAVTGFLWEVVHRGGALPISA